MFEPNILVHKSVIIIEPVLHIILIQSDLHK